MTPQAIKLGQLRFAELPRYAAFGSKRGLFEAALDRYTDWESEHVD
jgi:hypothetical protein